MYIYDNLETTLDDSNEQASDEEVNVYIIFLQTFSIQQ